jgi:predicted dehydrogenase
MIRKREEAIQFSNIQDDWSLGFINEVAHFVECVLDDKDPYIGLDRAREQLAFTLAAYRSASEGRKVSPREI